MALLINGIKPFVEKELAKDEIKGYQDLNLGIMLARRILTLRNSWVLTPKKDVKKVYIGGFLTPLLVACKVPLSFSSPKKLKYLDVNHLSKSSFLDGKDGDKFVYSFIDSQGNYQWVYLPNPSITRVDNWLDIRFKNGEEVIIKEPIEPKRLAKKKKKTPIEEESTHGTSFGSSRYYHPSYNGRVQSEATKHALDGVKKNQRFNKWTYRAVYNLKKDFKKEIKDLKKDFKEQISDFQETISGLKSVIETFVFGKKSPPRCEEGSCSYDVGLKEARRRSTSQLPPQQSVICYDPPRASSHEAIAPRRKRRHIPTPSPPSSDNISFHLSDSQSEG